MTSKWNHIKTCCVLGVLCSAWNLYGDIYFLDFYVAHMSFDDNEPFAAILETSQPGNIFTFDSSSYNNKFWLFLAQAGGWMYPIWAYSTTVPLYIGLRDAGFWHSVVPCGILAYGLCIIGGALHSSFAFLTILPNAYHQLQATAGGENEEYQELVESSTFFDFLQTTQQTVVQHLFVGFLPGYVACNVAGIWILVVVFMKSNQIKFPKWFNLFNPIVTMIWVSIFSAILSDPWGLYIYGSLGTWGVLMLNLGTSYYLWYEEVVVDPFPTSPTTSNEEQAAEGTADYVGGNYISYGSVPSIT